MPKSMGVDSVPPKMGKWGVTYRFNGRRYHLGYYDEHTEAAVVYSNRFLI
jgi:hypothetical protein